MRVIAGTLGGRRFYPPSKLPSRPTTDFGKTGLFNILNNHFDFTAVSCLDLFAGTGNISYEFISRGSPHVVAVDQDRHCIEFIRKMKDEWNLTGLEIIRQDVFRIIESYPGSFDIIFAGPPYPLTTISELPGKILTSRLPSKDGWFILETNPKYDFSGEAGFFRKTHYGQTTFHFFRAPA